MILNNFFKKKYMLLVVFSVISILAINANGGDDVLISKENNRLSPKEIEKIDKSLWLYNGGNAYLHKHKNYDKALELHLEALSIREKVWGADYPHEDIIKSYRSVYYIYLILGKKSKANFFKKRYFHLLDKETQLREKQRKLKRNSEIKELNDNLSLMQSKLQYEHGLNLYKNNNYKDAIELLKKTLNQQIKINSKNNKSIPVIYDAIGSSYMKLWRLDEAYKYYRNSLDIRLKNFGSNSLEVSSSYNIMGEYFHETGDHDKALEYLEKSLYIKEKNLGDRHEKNAVSYANLASLYSTMGYYSKSFEYFNISLNIIKKNFGENSTEAASNYGNIAALYNDTGDYSKALEFHKKSLSIRKKIVGENHLDIALSYNNIGVTYDSMGNYLNALRYYEKALIIRKAILDSSHPDIASIYNNIGMAHLYAKNYSESILNLKKALSTFQVSVGEDHPSIAICYSNIGEFYNEKGNYKKALESYEKALSIVNRILRQNHPLIATNYNQIGKLYTSTGNVSKGLHFVLEAIRIRKEVLGENSPITAGSYKELSKIHLLTKNYEQAYIYAKKAFDIFLLNRDKDFISLNSSEKSNYIKYKNEYIKNLAKIFYEYSIFLEKNELHKKHSIVQVEMINFWLNYKGSIVHTENKLLYYMNSSKNLNTRNRFAELIKYKKQYAILRLKAASNQDKQLLIIDEKISNLTHELSKRNIYIKNNSENITVNDISKKLSKNEIYMDFGLIDDAYFLFLIDDQSYGVYHFDKSETISINILIESLNKNLLMVQNSISNEKLLHLNFKDKSSELYDLILNKPSIKRALKSSSKLIVSSDNALRLLPFEALYDSKHKQYLIEKKNIRYISSAHEFIRAYNASNNNFRSNNPILFANPDYGNISQKVSEEHVNVSALADVLSRNLPSNIFPVEKLNGTKKEAEKVKEILRELKPILYQENHASESRLLAVKSPKILHIATHGYFDAKYTDSMLKSGLLMAKANISYQNKHDNGIIPALKLSGINLKGTEIVVLSACNTGKIEPDETEGISGLTKAFIQAGAKKVIITLWSISDNKTAKLMEYFYLKISSKASYSEALKLSKEEMIKEGMHPYYWAGFILYGL